MNIDTATVEELWPLLSEKLPGLKAPCSNCRGLSVSYSPTVCTPCHNTGTVPIAPSMERLLQELRSVGFRPQIKPWQHIQWQADLGAAYGFAEVPDPMLALCRAAAAALEGASNVSS